MMLNYNEGNGGSEKNESWPSGILDTSTLERGEFCKLSGSIIEYFVFKIVDN